MEPTAITIMQNIAVVPEVPEYIKQFFMAK